MPLARFCDLQLRQAREVERQNGADADHALLRESGARGHDEARAGI